MLNRKFLLVSAVLAGSLAFTGCDSNSKSQAELYDTDCLIGHEDAAIANQYIGKLKTAVSKAGMFSLMVNGQEVILNVSKNTQVKLGEDAEAISDVEKGQCLAVQYSVSDDREVARNVSLLAAAEVPANLTVGTGALAEGLEAGDMVAVDTRPQDAFESGSIPGALNVSYSALKDGSGFETLAQAKGKTVAFYCENGMCASAAASAELAKAAGYKDVKVLDGGLNAWQMDENIAEVHPAYLAKRFKAGVKTLIVDARHNASIGHAPGAINIQMDNFGDFEDKFPANMEATKVFVYSAASDAEGAKAMASEIIGLGYLKTYVVKGGWENLKNFAPVRSQALISAITYKGEGEEGSLTAEEFYKVVSKQLPPRSSFIDVREQDEIADEPSISLIDGENIPLSEIQDKIVTLDANKTYYFVCPGTGVRAGLAQKFAKENGLKAYFVNSAVNTDGRGGLTIGYDYVLTAEQIQAMKGGGAKEAVMIEAAPEAEGC